MSPHCLGYITGSWASSFDHRHLVKQDVSRAQFKPSLPILSYRHSESKTSCSAQSLLPTMVPGKNQNQEFFFFGSQFMLFSTHWAVSSSQQLYKPQVSRRWNVCWSLSAGWGGEDLGTQTSDPIRCSALSGPVTKEYGLNHLSQWTQFLRRGERLRNAGFCGSGYCQFSMENNRTQ